MPEVSIIVPCYNHGHYLSDALQSVLAQTFADWEAIIVDDGSTDDTRSVAAQFVDPRIRYIYQDNQGLSAARNTGIRAAQGELVALLDADDAWQPAFLETMTGALASEPCANAAYCGFRYMDGDGNPLPTAVCRVVPPEQFRAEMLKGSWLGACAVVVRRSAYEEAGPFDEALPACEDTDMWLRIAQHHRFVGVPKVLVRYRRAGNNMSDDVERMGEAMALVLEKHLGSLGTPVESWPSLKRFAVSQLYSMQAQGYLAQGDAEKSAEALLWLLRYRLDFALSLDLWYSLACVHQLVGQRGDFATWDPVRGEKDVMAVLEQLTRHGISRSQPRAMRGQAHFALALLNYGKGRVATARLHLLRSFQMAPRLTIGRSRVDLVIRLLPGMLGLKLLLKSRGFGRNWKNGTVRP